MKFRTPRGNQLVVSFVLILLGFLLGNLAAETKPNFIVILADDLGYGDLACYGSRLNKTPHIDRLAAEGVRFTDFHSNGPMCTPTRAALLTGMYQQRLGQKFESALSGKTHYEEGLPHAARTLAEVLNDRGYVTGCFGKWHLGYQPPFLPTDHGFDEFVGLASGDGDHHSHIDRSGRADWWHNKELVSESGYTADLLVEYSLSFIDRHRSEPFFLYLPHLAIHFPWQGPDDPPHRKLGTDYWNDKWGVIPDPNNVRPHVKAMVESIDKGLGEIVAALRGFDLDENTMVVFLSDNGGYTHYGESHRNISSNGRLRGQKTELFEGGHRVPAIAWWPGKIRPGVSDQTVMSFDLMPTFLSLAGSHPDAIEAYDGVDLSGLLFEGREIDDRILFWQMDDEAAVRQRDWKWIKRGDREASLYHLGEDLGEKRNLADSHPGKVAELSNALNLWRRQFNARALAE